MEHKKRTALLLSSCVLGLGFAAQPVLADDDDHHRVRARLSGYEEVHFVAGPPAALRGAVSTAARGTFRATIDKDEIRYRLSYEGLEADITQAHIHFGQPHTVGGIVVWLCQTPGTPGPAGTPFCPGLRSGTVEGTITSAQVLAQLAQGISAGEFDELVRAIRAGATYANVHSAPLFPQGEIRGAIRGRGDD